MRKDGVEAAEAPGRQRHPGGASNGREHRAFRQQLSHDAPASRAQRAADRDFHTARRRAREEQVRNVRAGYEKDEQHRAEQQPQRPAHVADDGVEQGLHDHGVAADLVGVRGGDSQLDVVQVRSCLLDRDTAREPPHSAEVVGASLVRVRVAAGEHERHPEIGSAKRESGGHDANDQVRHRIDRDRPADDGRIGTVPAFPQRVSEDHDARPALARLVRDKSATEQRLHPKRVDERGADVGRIEPLGFALARQRERALVVGDEVRERLVLCLPVHEVRR